MEIDEPEKPPIDHVAMTFERTQNGWKATAQTKVGELSATGASIAEAKAALKELIGRRITLRSSDRRTLLALRGRPCYRKSLA